MVQGKDTPEHKEEFQKYFEIFQKTRADEAKRLADAELALQKEAELEASRRAELERRSAKTIVIGKGTPGRTHERGQGPNGTDE